MFVIHIALSDHMVVDEPDAVVGPFSSEQDAVTALDAHPQWDPWEGGSGERYWRRNDRYAHVTALIPTLDAELTADEGNVFGATAPPRKVWPGPLDGASIGVLDLTRQSST